MRTAAQRAATVLALLFPVAGCGSTTSETTVGPTPARCQVAVAPTTASVGAGGGSGSLLITTQPECTWTTTAGPTWISRISPASGQGSGQVEFQTTANTGAARTGTFSVADQTITVNQATGCTYAVQPTSLSVGPGGGPISVTVTSGLGCTWTATSQASWITATTPSGTGTAAATFSVAVNTGTPRSGTLTVAGRVVTVTQTTGCSFSISPSSERFGRTGGNGVVLVTAPDGCPWTAVSHASWITIRSGDSGMGTGSVVYTVSPLSFGQRSGTMTIAGRTFTVTQPNQGGDDDDDDDD
jgi:Viral BACON domain/Putative binding domain, N-terminal